MSGVDKVAGGGGTSDDELRGGGGYEGGTVTGAADGEAQGSGRRGGGGYNGGDAGGEGHVQQKIQALEKRIEEMEAQLKKAKSVEGNKFELVNLKQMTPSVLKDGTTFRTWREEFERYAGIKVKGLQGIMKMIGGKKSWGGKVCRMRWTANSRT